MTKNQKKGNLYAKIKENYGIVFFADNAIKIYTLTNKTILANARSGVKYLYGCQEELKNIFAFLNKNKIRSVRYERAGIIYRLKIMEKPYKKYIIRNLNNYITCEPEAKKNMSELTALCDLLNILKINLHKLRTSSLSSLAYTVYRKRFYKESFKVLFRLFNTQDDFLRPSFFGGRCGILQHLSFKKTPVFFYDIVSSYPYIMQKFFLPTDKPKIKTNLEYYRFDITKFFGFLNITFTPPKNIKLGVLAVRINKEPVYVTSGTYSGTYFVQEILLALKNNYKIIYHKAYEFNKSYLFSEYMDFFYQYKTNNTYKNAAKKMMNHLYGSFALDYKNPMLKLFFSNDDKVIKAKGVKCTGKIINNNLELYYKLTSKVRNVAISSAISSYGRVRLYNAIQNNDTLYFDTDSLVTTKPLKNEIVGHALGNFKPVYNLKIVDYIFISPKFYALLFEDLSEKLVVKGYLQNDFIWDFSMLKTRSISAFKNKTQLKLELKSGGTIYFNINTNIIINDNGIYPKI